MMLFFCKFSKIFKLTGVSEYYSRVAFIIAISLCSAVEAGAVEAGAAEDGAVRAVWWGRCGEARQKNGNCGLLKIEFWQGECTILRFFAPENMFCNLRLLKKSMQSWC